MSDSTPSDASGSTGDSTPSDASGNTGVIGVPVLDIQPNDGVAEGQITDAEGIAHTVNVVLVSEGKLQLTWSADGDISGYDVTILDAAGQAMVSQTNMSGTSATIDSVYLTPGEVYTLIVTAHTAADASVTAESTLYFALSGAEPEPVSVSEPEPVASSSEPTTTASEPEPQPEPEPEPVAAASEPEPEPVSIGVPVLDIQPNQGLIEMDVGGFTAPVYQVGDGTIALSWRADGDVSGYNVCILDSSGNAMVDQNLADTGASISSSYLIPGEIYILNVTAYAAADSSVVSNAAQYFTYVPAVDESTSDEASYDDSSYDESSYGDSSYDESSYGDSSYDDSSYDESSYGDSSYDDSSYDESYYDDSSYDESYYDDSSYDESYYDESSYDDSPAWTTAITPYSDYEEIWMLQQRLVEWKWLSNGSYAEGVLDEATVQAVLDFQAMCAEYGIGLIPCDPMEPSVETDTLALLFNTNGEIYANPYA